MMKFFMSIELQCGATLYKLHLDLVRMPETIFTMMETTIMTMKIMIRMVMTMMTMTMMTDGNRGVCNRESYIGHQTACLLFLVKPRFHRFTSNFIIIIIIILYTSAALLSSE